MLLCDTMPSSPQLLQDLLTSSGAALFPGLQQCRRSAAAVPNTSIPPAASPLMTAAAGAPHAWEVTRDVSSGQHLHRRDSNVDCTNTCISSKNTCLSSTDTCISSTNSCTSSDANPNGSNSDSNNNSSKSSSTTALRGDFTTPPQQPCNLNMSQVTALTSLRLPPDGELGQAPNALLNYKSQHSINTTPYFFVSNNNLINLFDSSCLTSAAHAPQSSVNYSSIVTSAASPILTRAILSTSTTVSNNNNLLDYGSTITTQCHGVTPSNDVSDVNKSISPRRHLPTNPYPYHNSPTTTVRPHFTNHTSPTATNVVTKSILKTSRNYHKNCNLISSSLPISVDGFTSENPAVSPHWENNVIPPYKGRFQATIASSVNNSYSSNNSHHYFTNKNDNSTAPGKGNASSINSYYNTRNLFYNRSFDEAKSTDSFGPSCTLNSSQLRSPSSKISLCAVTSSSPSTSSSTSFCTSYSSANTTCFNTNSYSATNSTTFCFSTNSSYDTTNTTSASFSTDINCVSLSSTNTTQSASLSSLRTKSYSHRGTDLPSPPSAPPVILYHSTPFIYPGSPDTSDDEDDWFGEDYSPSPTSSPASPAHAKEWWASDTASRITEACSRSSSSLQQRLLNDVSSLSLPSTTLALYSSSSPSKLPDSSESFSSPVEMLPSSSSLSTKLASSSQSVYSSSLRVTVTPSSAALLRPPVPPPRTIQSLSSTDSSASPALPADACSHTTLSPLSHRHVWTSQSKPISSWSINSLQSSFQVCFDPSVGFVLLHCYLGMFD